METLQYTRIMNPSAHVHGRRVWEILSTLFVLSILIAVIGYTALAEVVGGGVLVYVAFMLGAPLTRWLEMETEPGRELLWNVLLALVVVLALTGVGVMAAALR